MGTSGRFQQDPNAVLDYATPWYAWLGTDTISSHQVSAETGITVDSGEVNTSELTLDGAAYPAGTVVTVWLSGGTAGESYTVTVSIVTAAGRQDDRSIEISVRER